MTRFNLRVYALITNEFNEILISDEFRFGQFFSKFPGGGVEANEGIQAALFRELKEELQLEITSATFFYFNDFYQASAFDNSNLVAFYYRVSIEKNNVQVRPGQYTIPFFEEQEKQRWVALHDLDLSDLTFPIDRIALAILQKELLFTS
ncbi:MAG: NUDIX hydrolase [Sphingomonadales bacterium]